MKMFMLRFCNLPEIYKHQVMSVVVTWALLSCPTYYALGLNKLIYKACITEKEIDLKLYNQNGETHVLFEK
jgi:hypothetical protein